MSKIIPLLNKNKKTNPKRPSQEPPVDGEILEEGDLGGLKYRSYKRGVVHFYNSDGLVFKKDADLFENEMEKINPDSIAEGESKEIQGSGDNCDLIFKLEGGDIRLSLRSKQTPTMKKLRNLLGSLKKA